MYYQPLISIIVPIYKVEQYLPKCLDAIINQTYMNLEILLVDDGSPDRCGEICDEYAKNDNRIKVIHKNNEGLADARNKALDMMKGEYVVCVDSDDYISSTHVEGLYKLIVKYGAYVAINTSCNFFDGTIPLPKKKPKKDIIFDSGLKAVEAMFYQELYDTCAWGKMYKANLFDGLRYPKGLLFEDFPTTYRLLLKANKVVFNGEQSYFYRLRSNSIERKAFSLQKLDSGLKLLEMIDQQKNILLPIIKSYNCRMVSFLFHLLFQMPKGYVYRKVFQEKIRKLRCGVLLDGRARKKTRIACLISFMGFELVEKIFCKMKLINV